MKASLDLLLTLLRMTLASGRRLRVELAMGLGEEILSVALGVSAPFLLKRLLDRLTGGSLLEVSLLASGFALSWIAPSLFSALKLSHTTRIVGGLFQEISSRAARRQLPRLAAVEAIDSADVVGVLERLPFSLQLVIDGLVWRAAPLLLQAGLGLVAVAGALPLRYAAILGTALLVYLLAADLGAAGLSKRAQIANQAAARVSAAVADLFRGAARVVANGAVEVEVAGLRAAADARRDANLGVAHRNAILTAMQFLVLGVGLAVLLIVAALDARAHRLRVSDFVLLQAFALRLALPLGGVAITVRQAGLAFATIRQALDMAGPSRGCASYPARPSGAQPGGPAAAALTLSGVAFQYPGAAQTLKDITLRLRPGEFIALVGANGSGKSTLARLMAGLLIPTEGEVLIGGVNCAGLEPSERVLSVIYVPQFISLFNRSLGANGLYPPSHGDPVALADRLRAWRFYDTDRAVDLHALAGEQGAQLSGGQIQKLELARLCDVPAPILILDESTSALDGPSEALILRALRAARPERLLIIVTHRRSIAEAADRVVFLHRGRRAGLGSHAALMDLPPYRRLWDREA